MTSKKRNCSIFDMEGCEVNRTRGDFNNPVRKSKRDYLFERLCDELRHHRSMLPYDKFWVVRIIESKIREGNL